ncbi:MAG: helicase HerA domain-containing protein [Microcoleaceae cyanobacterium]
MTDLIQPELALQALQEIDFDWTMHIKSVWRDSISDVKTLHERERKTIQNDLEKLKQAKNSSSPLGRVIIGEPGAGKTHFLAAIRQYTLVNDAAFILVDMTDVHQFWQTVLQGYLSSLQEVEADGIPQFQKLIAFLMTRSRIRVSPQQLAPAKFETIGKCVVKILETLIKIDRTLAIKFQDVVRALFLLNSTSFKLSGVGYNWLQGLGIDETQKTDYGFATTSVSRLSEIVEGLSWLMNLRSPTILAFDQLDSIISQHHFIADQAANTDLSEEQRVSRSIIEGIGGGLMALRDQTCRTLIVVSCLKKTWEILISEVVQSFKDRFQEAMILKEMNTANAIAEIIQLRIQDAYQRVHFVPPYETWPIHPEFFEAVKGKYPRKILQLCHNHRERCLSTQQITELRNFDPDQPSLDETISTQRLDEIFETAKHQAQLSHLLEENNEEQGLGTLLKMVCELLVKENPILDDPEVIIETHFSGRYPPLHGRIQSIFHRQGDREKHLCLRALQRTNATAYQSRLKAALTASGIDRSLGFRRLIIVRTYGIPNGTATQNLTQDFQRRGGLFVRPTEDELRTLVALQEIQNRRDPGLEAWLRDRRPVSQLDFLQKAVTWLFEAESVNSHRAAVPSGTIPTSTQISARMSEIQPPPEFKAPEPNVSESKAPELNKAPEDQPSPSFLLPIGARLIGQQTKETVSIPVQNLTKHTVILAGSGTGKTVLVRRLVEEAVILGIPAIVVDCANDLARLGDRWPQPPAEWNSQDQAQAERYHQHSQALVWTPGRESGNPLTLEPLPDLAAVANDSDELDQAADMARDTLQDIVAQGRSQTAILKRGVLKAALIYFAHHGGGRLLDFIELLSDLPPEAGGGIADADKKAQAMADNLRAEILNNPLLRQSGSALDPAILLGLGEPSGKTRVSILNFVGLPGLETQQHFLNQLFMTLFTWIKKNPAPSHAPLRGLLVLDEAKDFAPAGSTSTPCKASLNRLVAQARKYGLGIIFATQAPKSIDHNIIANCSTQFYGRANSPAAIEVIQEQLRQRGGSGQDIARLDKGQFYAVSESLTTPTKILAPLCLSCHLPTPLNESEILNRARLSRNLIQNCHPTKLV